MIRIVKKFRSIMSREQQVRILLLGDFGRLAHIQHKDFPALCISPCLQHKRYGFRYGHKIADNIRMRDRNRAALCNLLFKQRNDASALMIFLHSTSRILYTTQQHTSMCR